RHDAERRKRRARTESLPEEAARQLKQGIADDESLLDEADLQLRKVQLRHHPRGRDRHTGTLDVGNQAEAEEKGEDPPADPQFHPSLLSRVSRAGARSEE